ncbi:MAG: hypothetical protein JGK04_25690 [Microcoleus sp. PH2017_39_LGB_O_B]|uniref:hypothetical protein n=1 Tax=unclassified Microcoleus TaxID=2642155 RepID=UPI001DC1895B|nr:MULTISPECIES: hypothetical protein [unclassified Microcoleus]MCC3450834.1 hypothetical protein [Microcoleus sp. PH2017_09_SFU_O_A]MCC3631727.1 hypothetical protein [Microcoleus sp. PH2017_39_LGB_O_B]
MKLNLTCYLKKLQLVTKLQLFQRAGFRFRCNPCVCIEGRVDSWQLAVGSWQLAVGSWQLAVGSWQLAVGSWQLA